MKLYVRFGSLVRFQRLYEDNEYLQKVLKETDYNVWHIETDDVREIKRLMAVNQINYAIK